jgi:phenylacetate-CoA ligase
MDEGVLIDKACTCGLGFALMKPLTGRASEHLYLPNGRSLSPFLFTTSIEKTLGLLQYQVIQERVDAIRIKTIFEEGSFESGSAIIRSILMKMTENSMIISVENCDKINIDDNGKFMVVKNLIHDKQAPYAVN